VSAAEWVCLIGGTFLVIHQAWLLDDAFIYFRYVDDLVYLGQGLVYNDGEYVEGYSSPLWTIILIVLRMTGVNFWVIVRLVGIASFLVFWVALIASNRRLSPSSRSRVDVPLCYLTFNYGVLCYFTSGLEAPLVQVAAALFALLAVRPESRSLQLCLGLAPLVRHELAVPYAMGLAWCWFRERRFPWVMLASGAIVNGAWLAFRIYYYADLFPNTFYLRDGVWISQGLLYLEDTTGAYHLYPFLIVHLLVVVALAMGPSLLRGADDSGTAGTRSRESLHVPERLVMLALAAPVALYVIRIGGDARHYRYLAFPFCLAVAATGGVAEHALARLSGPGLRRTASRLLGGALVVACLAMHPAQLEGNPLWRTRPEPVNMISDAMAHRNHQALWLSPWGVGGEIEQKQRYRAPRSRHREPRVVAEWTCARIYRVLYGARVVHALGLTDAFLARIDVVADGPAHKHRLCPLAEDLRRIIDEAGNAPHRGMFREAVEKGAPRWIQENLATLEVIEKKVFNRHDWAENLRLAFQFPQKMRIPDEPAGRGSARTRAQAARARLERLSVAPLQDRPDGATDEALAKRGL